MSNKGDEPDIKVLMVCLGWVSQVVEPRKILTLLTVESELQVEYQEICAKDARHASQPASGKHRSLSSYGTKTFRLTSLILQPLPHG